MIDRSRLLWLGLGLVLGTLLFAAWTQVRPVEAANDRYEDYVMCTGPVGGNPKSPLDGVWLLDYRSGKLLGTIIDKNMGRIIGWGELDLVTEFGIPPRQDVHFLMTTGQIGQGQSALYVAETTTGKFAVYTMMSRMDGQPGVLLRRHDLVLFRQPKGN
jgi:hypothetical protein